MNKANGDLPAYPEPYLNDPHVALNIQPGLTKREYFAAMAMQGFCSNPFYAQLQHDKVISEPDDYRPDPILCMRSLQIADELLKQLES